MTPEERQMLTDLANKVAQTPAPARDPEAEEFIRTHIGSRPDALYMMTQTVLIQNMALEHAKQELEQLKQRASQPQTSAPQSQTSFTGRSSQPAGSPPPQAYSQPPGYAPPPPNYAPQPGYMPSAGAPIGPSGSGMGSFLRTAGTTAAGVAAGALAFEGIRSLFGGAEHMFGMGQHNVASGFLGNPGGPGETVINNYYDQPSDPGLSDDRVNDVESSDSPDLYDNTQVDDTSSDDSSLDSSDVSADNYTDYSDSSDSSSNDDLV